MGEKSGARKEESETRKVGREKWGKQSGEQMSGREKWR